MYKLHLPDNKIQDIERSYELQTIEDLENEMDREIDRIKKRAYSRKLSHMYEDMWSTGSFGLR